MRSHASKHKQPESSGAPRDRILSWTEHRVRADWPGTCAAGFQGHHRHQASRLGDIAKDLLPSEPSLLLRGGTLAQPNSATASLPLSPSSLLQDPDPAPPSPSGRAFLNRYLLLALWVLDGLVSFIPLNSPSRNPCPFLGSVPSWNSGNCPSLS